jgi:hypothetical protein
MSDFDQLIKEKVNSKEYAYSAKKWQSFTKKAGWRRGFSTIHWLLSGAAVVAVAVGLFFVLRPAKDAPQTSIPEQNIHKGNDMEEMTVSATDTAEYMEVAATEEQALVTPIAEVKENVANSNKLPETNPATETSPAADTVAKPRTPVQKPSQNGRITRIFVIDPDTIPSNDF